MGEIKKGRPVKLITGFIFKNPEFLDRAKLYLTKRFGKTDFESPLLAFNHTRYYGKEFGESLSRQFISFQKLISPDEIFKIKIFTNKTEEKLIGNSMRRINIDPGYLDLCKLVLLTTKDYTQRVYLNKGIYAEVTLFYRGKTFRPWEWTYPDYKTREYIEIFNRIREIYAKQKQ